VKKFLTKEEVCKTYSPTNQGIAVSIGICSFHAMAEASRFMFLYVDYSRSNRDGLNILLPVISGVIWNVLMRIGFMDRSLHLLSCGRWKPKNSSKFLRQAGYCMGYPRFGAVAALCLARTCSGIARPTLQSPLVKLALINLGAEVVEDLVSYVLWRLNVNLCPEAHFATDQEVEDQTQSVVRRRSQTDLSLSAVAPAPAPRAYTPLPTVRRRIRVAHDFQYGPEEFQWLPLWAHLMPVFLAQFHTILAMVIFSNGLVYIMGLCGEAIPHLDRSEAGVFFWPLLDAEVVCK